MIVETARLTLRLPTLDDADAYARFRTHPDVTRSLPLRFGDDPRVNAINYILMFQTCWRERGYGPWVAIARDDGRLVGHVGLRYLPEFGETEILWALHPEAWGRGYATEGARAARDHAFASLRLARVMAIALPSNRPSIAVMERIGLLPEGEASFLGHRVVKYGLARSASGHWRDRAAN
jgi:ribosomal-protein-alanine N-acetyltransferase